MLRLQVPALIESLHAVSARLPTFQYHIVVGLLFGTEEKSSEKISKSKVALSNVAKRMPGLVGGAAFGAILGYKLG